jgi:hypothetical protein
MILHTLNLECSFITLRKSCINQRPRCDIAWLHVTNHLWSIVRDLWNHLVRLRIYWKESISWWWEDKQQLLPFGDTGSELKPLVPLSPILVTSAWMLADNPEFDSLCGYRCGTRWLVGIGNCFVRVLSVRLLLFSD